jgi:hypothetical protein
LGSAIYAGHWMKSAKDLVERTSSRMRGIPVWLFSTGPIGDPLKPKGLPVDVAPILEQSGAREHRIFGGRLDKRELGLGAKAIVRIVGADEGDYRPGAISKHGQRRSLQRSRRPFPRTGPCSPWAKRAADLEGPSHETTLDHRRRDDGAGLRHRGWSSRLPQVGSRWYRAMLDVPGLPRRGS